LIAKSAIGTEIEIFWQRLNQS